MGRVGLNPFTRTLRLDHVRVPDTAPEAATGALPVAELASFETHVRLLPLLRSRIHLDTVPLVAPILRIVRVAPDRLNLSDVLARFAGRAGGQFTVALDHLALRDGAVLFEDRTLSPPSRSEARGLTLDLRDLSTVADADAGTASASFVLRDAPMSRPAPAASKTSSCSVAARSSRSCSRRSSRSRPAT